MVEKIKNGYLYSDYICTTGKGGPRDVPDRLPQSAQSRMELIPE